LPLFFLCLIRRERLGQCDRRRLRQVRLAAGKAKSLGAPILRSVGYSTVSSRREEFMNHYYKRRRVESAFSAIKRKFGDNVRDSMWNEVLRKLVCHNLCCVIKAQIELGIEATFWKDNLAVSRDG
jgi:hypothetical protein